MSGHLVKTPCIGVCSTGIGDSVCRGCKRFAHEVIDWNGYNPEQKAVVDRRLGDFLSQCVSNKLQVTDSALLQWQLQVQQLSYPTHHDEYCWVYSLIKAGASQIGDTANYGFQVDTAYRAMPLVQLRELIDQEFYILSQAHYERYMLTPDLFAGAGGMTPQVDIAPITAFLYCPTPQAWIDWALANPDILLVDHANCEKKAASTALNLMYRYVDKHRLLTRLSRLAREELRHFEQVIALMKARGIAYPQLTAARYAGELRGLVRSHEPARLVDTLLVGAIIEARSCERFAALVPVLDEELAEFYGSLLKSESRHFMDYLKLAEQSASAQEVAQRLPVLLQRERELIESADSEFRFHSGIPTLNR